MQNWGEKALDFVAFVRIYYVLCSGENDDVLSREQTASNFERGIKAKRFRGWTTKCRTPVYVHVCVRVHAVILVFTNRKRKVERKRKRECRAEAHAGKVSPWKFHAFSRTTGWTRCWTSLDFFSACLARANDPFEVNAPWAHTAIY